MAVADFFETFETWLALENFDNAEWIWQQWVEMILKKCVSKVWQVTKKGRWGNMGPATDLEERKGKNTSGNLPQLPNTTFMVVIRRVANGINAQTTSMQLQSSYTDVRHWEELSDFIEQNCGPKELYCLTAIYKCNLMQEELDHEYMGLNTPGQMINDLLYGQTSYNSSLSNAFKLKLGHNVNLFLVEMKAGTGKDIAEHVMRLVKVIPASLVTVSYAPTANQYTWTSKVSDENEIVVNKEAAGGKETDSSINVSSDWVNRVDCIPHIHWVEMLVCEIPNIVMNFRSARLWAHQPNLPRSNWKRSVRMERRPTKVQERFRSKWMERRTSIQIIPVQYWILF